MSTTIFARPNRASVPSTHSRSRAIDISASRAIARRLKVLAAADFKLASLPQDALRLDLRNSRSMPDIASAARLRVFLAEAGVALAESGVGCCAVDAGAIAPQAFDAGNDLGLAFFLITGARGEAGPLGAPEGLETAPKVLCFFAPFGGLSPRECRFFEDRLSWLAANATLIAPSGVPPSVWLKRLAVAFRMDCGDKRS